MKYAALVASFVVMVVGVTVLVYLLNLLGELVIAHLRQIGRGLLNFVVGSVTAFVAYAVYLFWRQVLRIEMTKRAKNS